MNHTSPDSACARIIPIAPRTGRHPQKGDLNIADTFRKLLMDSPRMSQKFSKPRNYLEIQVIPYFRYGFCHIFRLIAILSLVGILCFHICFTTWSVLYRIEGLKVGVDFVSFGLGSFLIIAWINNFICYFT